MPMQGGRGREMSDEEMAEHAATWSGLTPIEKLRWIKRNVR